MEISDAVSTEEMRIKLQNLREHMPGEPQFTYDFGAYLATRLNSQLNPIGFNMAVQLTLYDLQKGVNGFTGKPVPHSLSGMPASFYTVMEMNIPRFARAVCPSDFADKVDQVYAETHKK
ncbi:hypothetical protein HYV88_06215 [Candidatus Woesearchaeota archaeon]|nr:hypothetical protein [Candidatus Woesearchaeota archaeon]